jgi:integrase
MKKYHFPRSLEYRLYVRRPQGRRRSFGISKQREFGDHAKVEAVNHPTLDAINRNFLAGKISASEAEKEIEFLVEELYRKAGATIFKPVSNNENMDHLQRFWDAEYSHRDIVDPASSLGLFRRAVESLGPISLLSGSQSEVQAALDKKFEVNVHGRMVGCIKTLLKFLGRYEIRLRKKRQPRTQPHYLTEDELDKVLKHIGSAPFRVMCQMAFYSGCRKGELFALHRLSLKPDGSLYIAEQVREDGEVSEPKSGSVGSTFLFKNGRELFPQWIELKNEISASERVKTANLFRAACKKAFPKNRDKWLKFHDLRHSYAIAMLDMGASLGDVAQNLRNDIRVCQRFYAGFTTSQTRMLGLMTLEKRRKS